MDQLHTANKVCGGCCAISLNTVDTESSVSPTSSSFLASVSLYINTKSCQSISEYCRGILITLRRYIGSILINHLDDRNLTFYPQSSRNSR